MGHVALKCYHHFDQAYQFDPPRSLSAHYTSSPSLSDRSWYPDSAATNHLTSDLQNLNLSTEPYSGPKKIHVGDCTPLPITHIGDSQLSSSSSKFLLRKLLHVYHITKNLVFVQQFCHDNSIFFEFHASNFFVKDKRTGTPLLQGPTRNGLYLVPPPASPSSGHVALIGERTTLAQ